MKKFLALLSLFSLLTAFTCENEPLDDGILDNTSTNDNLIGTWNLVEFNIDLTTSSSFEGQETTSNIVVNSTEVDYVLEFTGSTFSANGSYTYNTNSVVNEAEVSSETYTLTNVSGSGFYTTNENEMTVDGSFFEFEFEGDIDTSALEGEQTATFEISDDGETLTFSQNETTTETNAATGLQANVTKISTSVWTRGVATNNCTLQTATDAAATAYNNDNTEDLCNAYKTALQNQIAECGDANGSLQAIIDDLGDCTIDNVSNGDLRVTTGTLVIDFTTQSIETDNGVITVNGTSSSGSYSIYFQVTEGETGTDVLQNFKLTLNETEYLPSTQGVEDFTSNTTVNSGNILQATFYGLVVNNDNGTLSLTQGVADLTY